MTTQSDLRTLRVLLFTGIMFLLVLMSPLLTAPFAGTEMYGLVGTALFFLNFGLIYIIVLVFLRLEGRPSLSEVGFEIEDSRMIPHLAIGAVAGTLAAGLVVLIAMVFGGNLRPIDQVTVDLIVGEIVITAPTAIFEEIAYRGYMMPRMVDIWGKGSGILIGSLFFSLFHFGWWVPLGSVPLVPVLIFILNLTIGGILLSLSYYWSDKRLWVPIGFHFMWNMLAYILFPVYPRETVVLPEIFQIEWGVTTIVGFLFGLSIIWMLITQYGRKR
ncbi:MAG: lysostaphin resistance A-like protein [Candidatus Thorarchaeota archaeon]